jgi:hypothetical protein
MNKMLKDIRTPELCLAGCRNPDLKREVRAKVLPVGSTVVSFRSIGCFTPRYIILIEISAS